MNEITRQTITNAIHDLENNLRVNHAALDNAQRDAVRYQALVNQDQHKITELKTALAKMDGER
jgi:hypothetical protein